MVTHWSSGEPSVHGRFFSRSFRMLDTTKEVFVSRSSDFSEESTVSSSVGEAAGPALRGAPAGASSANPDTTASASGSPGSVAKSVAATAPSSEATAPSSDTPPGDASWTPDSG